MSQRVYWELGIVADRSGNLYRITSNHARARREMGHCELWGVFAQFRYRGDVSFIAAPFPLRTNRFCHVDWRAKDNSSKSVLQCLVSIQRWLKKWTVIRKQRMRGALALVLRCKLGQCLGRDMLALVMSRL